MSDRPNAPHLTIYYDNDMYEADSKGWCVEFSDGSTTHRFQTLSEVNLFIMDNIWWLSHYNTDKEQV